MLTTLMGNRSPPRGRNHLTVTSSRSSSSTWRRRNKIVFRIIVGLLALLALYYNNILMGPTPNSDELARLELKLRSRGRINDDNKNIPQQQQQQQQGGEVRHQERARPRNDSPNILDADAEHRVAGLTCETHGGPTGEQQLNEMVYWRDIPSDADFVSPLKHPTDEQYMTFEPDEGGWNNIRMAMETAIGLSIFMGRTLVLPPKMKFYRLWDGVTKEKNVLSFSDFFHVDSIVNEHVGLKVMEFEEFLKQYALQGKFRNLTNPNDNVPSFPPNNRTDWTGAVNFEATRGGEGKPLWEWMRSVTRPLNWTFDNCVVGLPSERGPDAVSRMRQYLNSVLERDKILNYTQIARSTGRQQWTVRWDSYVGHPTPVNANPAFRLAELLANRRQMCIYDVELQNSPVVHAIGETSTGFRLLIHFYAYLFLEDYHHDLWLKRFIRDHFRYNDEIQCAAARIVAAVRENSKSSDGSYHSFHVRRGDFQYKEMHLSAEEIYNNNVKGVIPDGQTIYVATDEKNKTFFDPLREHYDLVFLDDYLHLVQGLTPNYYGMLDQLVASRGEIFFGSLMSTFSGYINRIRGYHSSKHDQTGAINSYYYVPKSRAEFRSIMRKYRAVRQAFWMQEFPVCWRDIDHDVVERRRNRRRRNART